MTGADDDERFEFGLDLIIAGLEAVSLAEKAARRSGIDAGLPGKASS